MHVRSERGKDLLDRKTKAETEIQNEEIQPVQPLRPFPGLLSQVRDLSHLFQDALAQGGDPRGEEGKLVEDYRTLDPSAVQGVQERMKP